VYSKQAISAFAHSPFKQSPLQSMALDQTLKASEILIQTGTHVLDDLDQENSSVEGITFCVCALMVQIPA